MKMKHGDLLANANVSISLNRFMELMRMDAARDLVRKINKFTQEMEVLRKPDPNKDSRLVQAFLSKMESDLVRHRFYDKLSETDRLVLQEGIELYVMTKLYKRTFGRYKEDQERDAVVSSRLFALQFVTPSHLDIPSDITQHDDLISAMRELQKINAFKAPRDKLSCVLACCQAIMSLLQSAGHETGADEFVPLLNYVVIKTQPIHLISNIEFIKRFRMKSRLVSYSEYYFTQLICAAYFIEGANESSFTNGKQDFLSSFLQQGLITWNQYQDAMKEGESVTVKPRSILSTGDLSDDTSLIDLESRAGSILSELRSITDDSLGRSFNFEGVTDAAILEEEGHSAVNQLAASGDLARRHPFLSSQVVDLKVESVEHLLVEYKYLALSYESLVEAINRNDVSTVLKILSEYETKDRRSVWPADGQLLRKYPFIVSSFQDLTLKDVAKLLNCYKQLVLRCESLLAGVRNRTIVDPQKILDGDFSLMPSRREEDAPLITDLSRQLFGRSALTDQPPDAPSSRSEGESNDRNPINMSADEETPVAAAAKQPSSPINHSKGVVSIDQSVPLKRLVRVSMNAEGDYIRVDLYLDTN